MVTSVGIGPGFPKPVSNWVLRIVSSSFDSSFEILGKVLTALFSLGGVQAHLDL